MDLHRIHTSTSRRRAMTIVSLVVAGLAVYFIMSLAIFPSIYLGQYFSPKKPAPSINLVELESNHIVLGQEMLIRVLATNNGDDADMQTISVGFPNFTSSTDISIVRKNLPQSPIGISQGTRIGYGYSGNSQTVLATYAAIEAQIWPWEHGKSYEIDLGVRPHSEGNFVIFVKSVAMPQTNQASHFPRSGTIDQQAEFVQVYKVHVAKT